MTGALSSCSFRQPPPGARNGPRGVAYPSVRRGFRSAAGNHVWSGRPSLLCVPWLGIQVASSADDDQGVTKGLVFLAIIAVALGRWAWGRWRKANPPGEVRPAPGTVGVPPQPAALASAPLPTSPLVPTVRPGRGVGWWLTVIGIILVFAMVGTAARKYGAARAKTAELCREYCATGALVDVILRGVPPDTRLLNDCADKCTDLCAWPMFLDHWKEL